MRDDDGRKLNHEALEVLRIQAITRVAAGEHPEELAAALGLHRKTVYGWVARYREGGTDALRARPVPGRPPKLSGPQLSRLYSLIVGQDPRQLTLGFELWTREIIREVIHREFDVALSAVSVGRLLRKLGLSPQQRPLHGAYQQDPAAVDRWKQEIYPAIRAEAQSTRATIYFADETRVGARPVANMICAVSARGAPRFAVYEGNTTAATLIDFCSRLLHDVPGPVYLVVTGHPGYRETATREFAAASEGRLRLIHRTTPAADAGARPRSASP